MRLGLALAAGLLALPALAVDEAVNGQVYTLPNPAMTPGAAIETDRYVICSTSLSTLNRRKVRQHHKDEALRRYGIEGGPDYVIDHLIPLEIGGHPTDPRNLWPEPAPSAKVKDRLENGLKRAICAGRITVEAAQREIAVNWIAAYDAGLSRSDAWREQRQHGDNGIRPPAE